MPLGVYLYSATPVAVVHPAIGSIAAGHHVPPGHILRSQSAPMCIAMCGHPFCRLFATEAAAAKRLPARQRGAEYRLLLTAITSAEPLEWCPSWRGLGLRTSQRPKRCPVRSWRAFTCPSYHRLPVSPLTAIVTPSPLNAAVLAAVRRIQNALHCPVEIVPSDQPSPSGHRGEKGHTGRCGGLIRDLNGLRPGLTDR